MRKSAWRLLAALVASFLLGASGCGSDNHAATPTPPPTTVKPPPTPPEPPAPKLDEFIIGIPNKKPEPGMTCYIFGSNGSVEKRIEPRDDTTLAGDYSGDKSSGRITWADGGKEEYSSADGHRYSVTHPGKYGFTAYGSRIKTCTPRPP